MLMVLGFNKIKVIFNFSFHKIYSLMPYKFVLKDSKLTVQPLKQLRILKLKLLKIVRETMKIYDRLNSTKPKNLIKTLNSIDQRYNCTRMPSCYHNR